MVNELQKEYHTKCFRLFMEHFKTTLDKNHSLIDIAEGNKIYKLQGQNELLKVLLQLGATQREVKYKDHDGGFGV